MNLSAGKLVYSPVFGKNANWPKGNEFRQEYDHALVKNHSGLDVVAASNIERL
jgi:hypothetical protein